MNTRLLTAFGLLPVLAFNATACRSVGGYSDLQAQLRSTNQVKVQMYGSGGAVEVVPLSESERTVPLRVGTYTVGMRRERDNISYETDKGGHRVLVANGSLVPGELSLEELEGIPATKPLTWTHTMKLDRTDYAWKAGATTWKEHEGIIGLSTTWANVQRVTATQHGSPVLKGVGWGGAIAAYLTGAALMAYQFNNWTEEKRVNGALIYAGGGLLVVGIPFIFLGLKNRSYKVSVYGDGKGSRVR